MGAHSGDKNLKCSTASGSDKTESYSYRDLRRIVTKSKARERFINELGCRPVTTDLRITPNPSPRPTKQLCWEPPTRKLRLGRPWTVSPVFLESKAFSELLSPTNEECERSVTARTSSERASSDLRTQLPKINIRPKQLTIQERNKRDGWTNTKNTIWT